MSKDPLETAIDLVKMGKQSDALSILTMLIRNDPHDEKAWVWLIQAVPHNQRRQAAEMFFKDNPNSDLAKKALQVVGREISFKPAATPITLPLPDVKKIGDAASRESSENDPAELGSMMRGEGNILPKINPNSVDKVIRLPRRKRNILVPAITVGVLLVLILVLVVLNQAGMFSNLMGGAPAVPPNVDTQFAVAQKKTPRITTTSIKIISPTQDIHATPTAALATLSSPLATPAGAPVIGPDNAVNLKIVSRAQAPQEKDIISPLLRYILPLNGSSEIKLLDFNTHATLFRTFLPSDSLVLAAFTPDEAYLAAGINHGDIVIYDIPAQKSIRTIQAGPIVLENTGSMAFSGDGHTLAVISDGKYGVWNVDSGELLGSGDSLNVVMAVSSKLLYMNCSSFVCAEDIMSGTQVRQYETDETTSSFALSMDSNLIAVESINSNGNESVKVFKTDDGTQIAAVDLPLSTMWGLAFSPDGRTLSTWGVNSSNSQYSLVVVDVDKSVVLTSIDIGPYSENAVKPQRLSYTPDGIGITAVTLKEVLIFAAQ